MSDVRNADTSSRATQRLEELKRAARQFDLVRLHRETFDGDVHSRGFVCAVSTEWILLQKFTDRLDLDGFEMLRITDLTSVSTDFAKKDFYLRCLSVKGLTPERPAGVDIKNLSEALRTIVARFGLVVVYREMAAPEESIVGRVTVLSATGFKVRAISSAAKWYPGEEFVLYSSVTRLEFGGGYEMTLNLVSAADTMA